MLKNVVIQTLKNILLYAVLCAGILLMLRTIVSYTSFEDTTGFLKYKQDFVQVPVWRAAFYIHVFASIFTLLAGLTQFNRDILHSYPRLHRWIGKAYVFNILFVNFPSAFIMAICAYGFLPSKIAFVTLDVLWFWFTMKAWIDVRNKNIEGHRRNMIRSYALTCSALTLRLWKLILTSATSLDPVTIYMIDAWVGFIPNLIMAEIFIRTYLPKAPARENKVITIPPITR
jgi:uncharacterized membrane protein